MPRGRAGLQLVKPEKVQEVFKRSSHHVPALYFNVSERTVRRWVTTGLPLYYRNNPTPDEWEEYCALPWDKRWPAAQRRAAGRGKLS